jgi:Glycosyl transferase 4-like domain
MSKFLFTMLPANDLGLPTRLVRIARALADRGHDVAVLNPAPAPAKLIDDAGLKNLPMPSRALPDYLPDLAQVSSAWDAEELLAAVYPDEEYARAAAAAHVDLLRDFAPDVVVDSFGLLPARPDSSYCPFLFGISYSATDRSDQLAKTRRKYSVGTRTGRPED